MGQRHTVGVDPSLHGCFPTRRGTIADHAPGMLPTPADSVIFRRLETGAVVYDSAAEVYYGLNDVGAAIWELLGDPELTRDRVLESLASTYPDADKALLRADFDALIDSLVGYGLLRVRAAA